MRDFLKDLAVGVIAFCLTLGIIYIINGVLLHFYGVDKDFTPERETIPMVIGFDSTYYDMGNAALDVNAFVTRGELSELNQETYEKNIAPGQFGDITVYFGEDAVHLTYYNTYDLDITTGLAKVTSITTSASGINVNDIAVGDDVQTVLDKMGDPDSKDVNKFENVDKLVYETTDDSMCVTFDFDNNGNVIYLSVDNYNIADLKEEFTVTPEPKY